MKKRRKKGFVPGGFHHRIVTSGAQWLDKPAVKISITTRSVGDPVVETVVIVTTGSYTKSAVDFHHSL